MRNTSMVFVVAGGVFFSSGVAYAQGPYTCGNTSDCFTGDTTTSGQGDALFQSINGVGSEGYDSGSGVGTMGESSTGMGVIGELLPSRIDPLGSRWLDASSSLGRRLTNSGPAGHG